MLFFLEDYSYLRANDLIEFYQGNLKLTLIIRNIIAPFMAGIVGGGLLIFVVRNRLRKRSYGVALLEVGFYYFLIYLLIMVVAIFAYEGLDQGAPLFGKRVPKTVIENLQDPGHLRGIFRWLVVIAGTQFILLISDKFGPGVLPALILGKYRHPRNENRIFMFLDLKSSTTIAEKLGTGRYNDFLNDFFTDITDPILNSGGEIYQYVGDEVVVSWKRKNGLKNSNCLKCFFLISEVVENTHPEYQKKYGIVPEFKAGIHIGEVTVGEIGIIKRDITYSGDVLNTAARIQATCNALNERLLVSDELLQELDHPFKVKRHGKVELRGKSIAVEISGLTVN